MGITLASPNRIERRNVDATMRQATIAIGNETDRARLVPLERRFSNEGAAGHLHEGAAKIVRDRVSDWVECVACGCNRGLAAAVDDLQLEHRCVWLITSAQVDRDRDVIGGEGQLCVVKWHTGLARGRNERLDLLGGVGHAVGVDVAQTDARLSFDDRCHRRRLPRCIEHFEDACSQVDLAINPGQRRRLEPADLIDPAGQQRQRRRIGQVALNIEGCRFSAPVAQVLIDQVEPLDEVGIGSEEIFDVELGWHLQRKERCCDGHANGNRQDDQAPLRDRTNHGADASCETRFASGLCHFADGDPVVTSPPPPCGHDQRHQRSYGAEHQTKPWQHEYEEQH